MRQQKGSRLFLAFVACAAIFVWFTGSALPGLVASHFGSAGTPNGFMPRGVYIAFMLVFVIGLPLLLVLVTSFALGRPNARINLPNRDYWLAPERRAETIDFLRASLRWFGALLVAFLCYAHWLVVRANESQPVQLAQSWFIGGLVVFLIGTFIWLRVLLGRFRNPTDTPRRR
jgi:Domain of unknown function (DUF1648)